MLPVFKQFVYALLKGGINAAEPGHSQPGLM
jgi:hypothetical protein